MRPLIQIITVFFAVSWLSYNVRAQLVSWNRNYGGDAADIAFDVKSVAEGGLIVAGQTASFGDQYSNVWLLRTDQSGDTLWTRSIGNSQVQRANAVAVTDDGGFLAAGVTHIFEETFTADILLTKVSSSGELVWTREFGGNGEDVANDLIADPGAGAVLAGYTTTYGAGARDIFLIKIDESGAVRWEKTYGDSENNYAQAMDRTAEGGYVLTGTTGPYSSSDLFVLVVDAEGNELWSKDFGGSGIDLGYDVRTTSDGGYVVAGWTQSFGAVGWDFYVIRLDVDGNVLWQNRYGGDETELAEAVCETTDGGFIVVGRAGRYSPDFYVVRLDDQGEVQWDQKYDATEAHAVAFVGDASYVVAGEKSRLGPNAYLTEIIDGMDLPDNGASLLWAKEYGGTSGDRANAIAKLDNGGSIVVGQTASLTNNFHADLWLFKVDDVGNTLWSSVFGSSDLESADAVTIANNGDIVAAGSTQRFERIETRDVFVVRTNKNGELLWSRTFGTTAPDYTAGIVATEDGGVVIGGHTSAGGSFTDMAESSDYGENDGSPSTGRRLNLDRSHQLFLLRLDADGNLIESRIFGSQRDDYAQSMVKTADNGFLLAGYKGVPNRSLDAILVKVDSFGDLLWTKEFGGTADDVFSSVVITPDSGYAAIGRSRSFGDQNWDLFLIRTDSDGNMLQEITYGNEDLQWGLDLEAEVDGGYVVSGLSGTFARDGFVLGISASGDSLWALRLEDVEPAAIQSATENEYVVAGVSTGVFTNAFLARVRRESTSGTQTDLVQSYPVRDNGNSLITNLPSGFTVRQNFPNPFNPSTMIEYSLPRLSRVSIEVYNLLGQKVRTLIDRQQPAGSYAITWDGTNDAGSPVATGVYLYRFRAGGIIETKKMLLMK
jgi:hypothetical protein